MLPTLFAPTMSSAHLIPNEDEIEFLKRLFPYDLKSCIKQAMLNEDNLPGKYQFGSTE
jgi:hypothetical protein